MNTTQSTYQTPSPLQLLNIDWAKDKGLQFYVKRDDLIHTAVSGNKWRKLKFNILQAKHAKKTGLLTFGGAYSNHILATAHACMLEGLSSIGIIRGDELNKDSNSILQQCSKWGMTFRFVSREEYNLKDDYEYTNELKDEFRDYQIIPEGGKNYLGIIGCQDIARELTVNYDDIWVAQGTCTTSIGIALSAEAEQNVHAVPVLKGFDSKGEIKTLMKKQGFGQETIKDVLEKIIIHPDFHFGGYGKATPELFDFIEFAQREYDLKLDPVYTAKAFYAVLNHYKNADITNRTIVFVHTGGLVAGEFLK